MMPKPLQPPFRILGIGSPWGDDRLGWVLIEQLEQHPDFQRLPSGFCQTQQLDRPGTLLMDAVQGAKGVILVDALHPLDCPGRIHSLNLTDLACARGLQSSHGLGVAETLGLAQILNSLPEQLQILGVEAANLKDSETLSAEVARAVPTLLAQILALLQRWINAHLANQTDKTPMQTASPTH